MDPKLRRTDPEPSWTKPSSLDRRGGTGVWTDGFAHRGLELVYGVGFDLDSRVWSRGGRTRTGPV